VLKASRSNVRHSMGANHSAGWLTTLLPLVFAPGACPLSGVSRRDDGYKPVASGAQPPDRNDFTNQPPRGVGTTTGSVSAVSMRVWLSPTRRSLCVLCASAFLCIFNAWIRLRTALRKPKLTMKSKKLVARVVAWNRLPAGKIRHPA